jgi:hypothetical protein
LEAGSIAQPSFGWSAWLVLFCSAGLLAIWSLPDTIALRNILLVLGFFASLVYLKAFSSLIFSRNAWNLWLLTAFFAWLLVHLVFFSHEFETQLDELQSPWLRCLLAIPVGFALGLILGQDSWGDAGADSNRPSWNKTMALLMVFLGLGGVSLISFGWSMYALYRNGAQMQFAQINILLMNLYAQVKMPFVVGAAFFLPLCFVLMIGVIHRKCAIWWGLLALIGIALSLFSVYFSNTKNGVAIFGLCLILFILNLVPKAMQSWRHLITGALALIVVVSLGLYGIYKHEQINPAWNSLIADFQVGRDIDHQDYWKNRWVYTQPQNQYGRPVDISTYERTAWFTAGTRLLMENPLGYGLIHQSFGRMARAKWPDFYKPNGKLYGFTHSGWLDFTLGVGLPGLLLMLIPLAVAWYRSLFAQGLWRSYAAMTIPVFVIAYLTTEVTGEHFTELSFFMTAFFCGITPKQSNKLSA